MPPRSNWTRRRERAEALRTEHPHASELLEFYGQVLGVQEPLFRKTRTAAWVDSAAVEDEHAHLRLHLAQLPQETCLPLFRVFVGEVGAVSTELLARIATRLAGADSPAGDVLEAFLSRQPLDELSASLDCKPSPLEFFPRAFFQPVVEAATQRAQAARRDAVDRDHMEESQPTCCPRCGWPPLLGIVGDERDEGPKGVRGLVCSLCSHAWQFPRSTCPACGESRGDQLRYHVTDFWPHLRVEECVSCKTYLKAVDVGADRGAVPVVDELASVELDLWAADEGLEKLQRNLLGL